MNAHIDKATQAKPHVPFRSWWMVSVLCLLYVFSILDRMILTMLVEPIKMDLKLTDFEMSLLLGPAFAVFYALFGLPLGWAADRYPRRWVIFGGVTLWGLATTASGFARSFGALLGARIGVGVGEAALNPAAYSLLADEFPRERLTTAISIYQTAAKFGAAAAFAVGGVAIGFAATLENVDWPILHQAEAWHLVMIMVGLPGTLLGLLVFTFREPKRRNVSVASDTENKGALWAFIRSNWQLVSLMMVGFSTIAICGYGLTAWVPTYVERAFGWGPSRYGPVLSIVNIVAGLSLIANGAIIDRLYTRGMKDAHLRAYLWLMAGIAPLSIVLFWVENPTLFLVLYGAVQVVIVPFMLYISSIVSLIAPNNVRGQMNALFLAVITLFGMGVGPMLVGGLTDFLFGDENKIGVSLGIILIGGMAVTFLSLLVGLRYLGPAVRRAEGGAAANI